MRPKLPSSLDAKNFGISKATNNGDPHSRTSHARLSLHNSSDQTSTASAQLWTNCERFILKFIGLYLCVLLEKMKPAAQTPNSGVADDKMDLPTGLGRNWDWNIHEEFNLVPNLRLSVPDWLATKWPTENEDRKSNVSNKHAATASSRANKLEYHSETQCIHNYLIAKQVWTERHLEFEFNPHQRTWERIFCSDKTNLELWNIGWVSSSRE